MDIIFLSHNRCEFTKASLQALFKNTDWSLVERLLIYDDDSIDGTREELGGLDYPIEPTFRYGVFGSPVRVMNEYLYKDCESHLFAKIDNDTMVPPLWLEECLRVMHVYPELDLLGIEAFRPVEAAKAERSYDDARFIGGIGLMRQRAFAHSQPTPNGRFGFTEWQEWQKKAGQLQPGWLNPALPVFLLDRLPREPWCNYSNEYITKGWQREWGPYSEESRELWSWWCE